MATAELAVAIPVLVAVLALALAAVRLGTDRIRAVDAAHVGARVVARGEPASRGRDEAVRHAADGSVVEVTVDAGTVRVTVTPPLPPVLAVLGVPVPTAASATARLESTEAGPP